MDFRQDKKNTQWNIIKMLTLHPYTSNVYSSSPFLAKWSIPLSVSWKKKVMQWKDSPLFWGHLHITRPLLGQCKVYSSSSTAPLPSQNVRVVAISSSLCPIPKPWLWLESYIQFYNELYMFYMRPWSLRPGRQRCIHMYSLVVCYVGNHLVCIICDVYCSSCLDVT